MKFYNVKDDYIQFLRGYDSKVSENKQESRPYVGVVLEIPVPDEALILMDINNEPDLQYRRLLQNQYNDIKKDAVAIERTADILRELVLKDDMELTVYDANIKARCCNLALLERIYKQYNAQD